MLYLHIIYIILLLDYHFYNLYYTSVLNLSLLFTLL